MVISNISTERLLDEFKKLIKTNGFLKISNDQFCLEVISLIFPQFKNINILKKVDIYNLDFIVLISLLIIDSTDNTEYFLFKFNLSNYDQKRILFLKNFFLNKVNKKKFSKDNLWKIFYLSNKQSLLDLLNYQMLKSQKDKKKLLELINFFKDKEPPILPIKARSLMHDFNIPEGKELGIKLKKIEDKWLDNNFKITDKEIQKLIFN